MEPISSRSTDARAQQTHTASSHNCGLQTSRLKAMGTPAASRQVKRTARAAAQGIKQNIDLLTGGQWVGAYEDSLYNAPSKGGLFDYEMKPEDIVISFTRRKKGDATFTADRVITYGGERYPETFIGSVSPEGRIVLTSLTDTDILIGDINPSSATLTLLFVDNGTSESSLGSQTAVGMYVFTNIPTS